MLVNSLNNFPEELRSFISSAGEQFLEPLSILAVAESLTDEVAIKLVALTGLSELNAKRFVNALHFADFVIERNSEWNFSATVRRFFDNNLDIQNDLVFEAHSLLFNISLEGKVECAGETIPRYLLSGVGRAYHKSPIQAKEGLKFYAETALTLTSGSHWLLGKLAIAQQAKGILPPEAIEPPFIRGMTLYREGRRTEAEAYLKKVAASQETRLEVAIACHIVGRLAAQKPGRFGQAEELLRKSISIGEEIGHRHHQAQALHTLGQLLGKNRNRAEEAEELLRRSLNIGEKTRNKNHQAQVLFSLGKLVWERDPEEGRSLLKQSVQINKSIKNFWAVRMVTEELAKRTSE